MGPHPDPPRATCDIDRIPLTRTNHPNAEEGIRTVGALCLFVSNWLSRRSRSWYRRDSWGPIYQHMRQRAPGGKLGTFYQRATREKGHTRPWAGGRNGHFFLRLPRFRIVDFRRLWESLFRAQIRDNSILSRRPVVRSPPTHNLQPIMLRCIAKHSPTWDCRQAGLSGVVFFAFRLCAVNPDVVSRLLIIETFYIAHSQSMRLPIERQFPRSIFVLSRRPHTAALSRWAMAGKM